MCVRPLPPPCSLLPLSITSISTPTPNKSLACLIPAWCLLLREHKLICSPHLSLVARGDTAGSTSNAPFSLPPIVRVSLLLSLGLHGPLKPWLPSFRHHVYPSLSCLSTSTLSVSSPAEPHPFPKALPSIPSPSQAFLLSLSPSRSQGLQVGTGHTNYSISMARASLPPGKKTPHPGFWGPLVTKSNGRLMLPYAPCISVLMVLTQIQPLQSTWHS